MNVGDRIRPGNMGRAFDHGVAGEPRIRAAVEIGRHLAGDNPPVLHDAVLDVNAFAAARRAELHFLVPAKPVTHRRAGQPRRQNAQRLGHRIDLAAKAAADRTADEMQLVGRHCIDFCGGVEEKKNAA